MADPAANLPLFFREIVPVDGARHGALHLDRGRNYRFARETNAIPITLQELAAVVGDYPIVFGGLAQPTMLAIVGYRDRENLYIDAAGAWRRGAYVPAYVRNYPFALIEAPDKKALLLGFDPRAASVGMTGPALFAEAQPTAALSEAAELCKSLHQALQETASFCAALEAKGLLVENNAVIDFKQGGQAVLRGFRVIDSGKFAALDDASVLDWRKRGWLAAVYAHFHAAARWGRIVDLAAAARA
ncbi:MAG TPA: SapC family protein [Stellaceae bacterium]|nr:SapC family protein [Stellaceae bacterium]